jgi:hypothetical protein
VRVQRLIADLLCPWFFVQAAGAAGSRCSSTGQQQQQQQIHDEPAALAHNWWESRREIGGAGCGRTAMAAIRPPPRVVQTTGSGSQQREVEWEVGRELGKVRRAATAARSLLGRPCHARGCAVLLCRGLLARRVLTALTGLYTGSLCDRLRVQELGDWEAVGWQGHLEGVAAQAQATAKGTHTDRPSARVQASCRRRPTNSNTLGDVCSAARGRAGHPSIAFGRWDEPSQCALHGQLVSGRRLLLFDPGDLSARGPSPGCAIRAQPVEAARLTRAPPRRGVCADPDGTASGAEDLD